MTTRLAAQMFLKEPPELDAQRAPPDSVLEELGQLAFATDSLADRSRLLFQALRKMVAQPRLVEYLNGLQVLALRAEPAGARLLAAFLDANTPGARLIPRIHSFSSTRRVLRHRKQEPEARTPADLDLRLRDLQAQCEGRQDEIPGSWTPPADRPGSERPFPLMRRFMRHFVATLYRRGGLAPADNSLLADLARLEVDAYQERISRLAGQIDPFRVTAVIRILPLLSRADAEIRDLREFLRWIEAGEVERAFHKRIPRSHEVMDERERNGLARALFEAPELGPLAELQDGLLRNAIPVSQLAGSVCRLMALARQLKLVQLRRSDLDLLTAVRIVQLHDRNGELKMELDPDLRRTVAGILAGPVPGEGMASWSLSGLQLEGKLLVLRLPPAGLSDRVWRDDLPLETVSEPDPGQVTGEEIPQADRRVLEGIAIKKLVLGNLGSVSVLEGFLRNPKIVGIPGLVAAVATRCRTLHILEMIANDRRLYTGYANQDVPRALLASPCNLPVKTLRKFIHVKYVAKVDLVRMARDKAGFRDEVVKEISSYLRSLAQ